MSSFRMSTAHKRQKYRLQQRIKRLEIRKNKFKQVIDHSPDHYISTFQTVVDRNRKILGEHRKIFSFTRFVQPHISNNHKIIRHYKEIFDGLLNQVKILQIDGICDIIIEYLLFPENPNFEDILKWISMGNTVHIRDTQNNGIEYKLGPRTLRKGAHIDYIKKHGYTGQCPHDIHDIPIKEWDPNWFLLIVCGGFGHDHNHHSLNMRSIPCGSEWWSEHNLFDTLEHMFAFLTHCDLFDTHTHKWISCHIPFSEE
eukprot:292432_1